MALVESVMNPLGFIAPKFDLIEPLSGNRFSFDDLAGQKGTLVIVMCNHCPYVKAILPRLVNDLAELQKIGINTAAISSNDVVNYPEDSYLNMQKISKEQRFPFPYLLDDRQETAKDYQAICTPDFFGYNDNLELQYRGRIRELKDLKPIKVGESDLFKAMKQISETGKGPKDQIPSLGCSIKWLDN